VLLQEIRLPRPGDAFPFTLPLLRGTTRIVLDAPVTVIVGENGSGKSTLLEGLAYACELPVSGAVASLDDDPTLASARALGATLRLSWTQRTRHGLFLRAEDYFGFVNAQNRMKAELASEMERVGRERPDLQLEELRRRQQPYRASIASTERRYQGDLDARSHGESFLAFFNGRLTGEGLYLLDEPEAALSPLRSLAFLSLVKNAVERGGQFIVATHSPILMAYPGARLYELRGDSMVATAFDDLEHVRTLRHFLEAPEAYLRHL
jgi:predicted ATPase